LTIVDNFTMTDANPITPKEITRANAHDVKIVWQDGHESIYSSRPLRLACPCAACVDEITGQIRVLPPNIPADIRPMAVRLVGRYAIAIDWSDNHRTGIYSFALLRRACSCESCTAAHNERHRREGGGSCGGCSDHSNSASEA